MKTIIILFFVIFNLGCSSLEDNIVEKPYSDNTVKFSDNIIYPHNSKPMNVTVYRFADFSGQRKQGLLYQEVSTAVPQGLDSMLMHSLSTINQGKLYKVIDRTFLSHMLDERQLASVSVSPKNLGILKVPSIVFTGGVIAYDHNNRQAAGGIFFNDFSLSSEYSVDTVTVSLRAVSVKTGEILLSSISKKSIVSVSSGINSYKIFDDNLMQLELGGAYNEPVSVATRLAIEQSILDITEKALELGWWNI
ncbi:CsgG/HfaB family protein [Vibrio sp. Isolate22]|uniref:CsgG/HfaB family protein n=1 Tax=Vibrio sp. Isolate22 TaxID=2908532 RepID=UPI001EFCC457|nr:CsgG/HfaB family protein [Vibrio sp. Isolate22]MCG9692667.1 CsgG/HfaB family protein [Vibrio sp. Isolate22]